MIKARTERTMRAVVQDRYGSPDVLTLADVPQPARGPGQALVRIEAAALNARAWHVMRGEPRLARLMDRSTFALRRQGVAAAAIPLAGTTARLCLDAAGATAGSTTLINDVSGDVGTVAARLADIRQPEVTAVGSPRKTDLVRELGAGPALQPSAAKDGPRSATSALGALKVVTGDTRLSAQVSDAVALALHLGIPIHPDATPVVGACAGAGA